MGSFKVKFRAENNADRFDYENEESKILVWK
jgi:hypothetical protein